MHCQGLRAEDMEDVQTIDAMDVDNSPESNSQASDYSEEGERKHHE